MQLLLVKILVVVLVIGLALATIGSTVFAVAVRGDIVPYFDQRIALDAQHVLVIHNGPEPTCTVLPTPRQYDCFWPGLGYSRRTFSVDYLTLEGARSLIWFRLR